MDSNTAALRFGTYEGIDKISTVPSITRLKTAFSLSASSFESSSKKRSVTSTQLYSFINGTVSAAAASVSISTSPLKVWKLNSEGVFPTTAAVSFFVYSLTYICSLP